MKTTEVTSIKPNSVGTCDIIMKIPGMRKPQEFTVYPMQKGDTKIKIQSSTRIGLLDMTTGEGKMSQSHQSGAYFHHLSLDKLTLFNLEKMDFESLKLQIFSTGGKLVGGDLGLSVNNEGATSILDL